MESHELNCYTINTLRDLFTSIIAGNKDLIICDPSQLKECTPFKHPCKLDAFILVLCSKGEGKIRINLNEFTVRPGMLFVNFPENIIQIDAMSDDLEATAVILSETCMHEIQTDIRSMLPLYLKFREESYLDLEESDQRIVELYIDLARELTTSEGQRFHKEKMFELSKSIAYHIASLIEKKVSAPFNVNAIPKTRKEVLFNDFMELLTQYHKQERSVKFYADRLCINPKYMSTVIREYSGRPAAEWIDEFVILEAKALLKYSDKSIQEIAYHLNFPTQSFFGKYYKHHTGMSPGSYKMEQD